MSCDDKDDRDSDFGPDEAMPKKHGERQGTSQEQEANEWNPFMDPASRASEGIEIHQFGSAPVMQPVAKAKGKSAYGSVPGKGQSVRIEPYDNSVEAVLAAGESSFSGCLDALQQYKDTVAATADAERPCG